MASGESWDGLGRDRGRRSTSQLTEGCEMDRERGLLTFTGGQTKNRLQMEPAR